MSEIYQSFVFEIASKTSFQIAKKTITIKKEKNYIK